MAIKLTADPQTVVLPDPVPGNTSPEGETSIAWDTGSASISGRVYLSIDGGTAKLIAGGQGGARAGNVNPNPKVVLGSTYVFSLRRANSNQLLASVTVTTKALQTRLIELATLAFQASARPPPQAIRTLRIDPGIDTVNVAFTTVYPTIPRVDVEMLDGSMVAQSLALFNGLQRRHRVSFGFTDPLPQRTDLRLRITVPGRSPVHGLLAADVVRTIAFKTGRRAITVFLDTIDVHTDGDPGIKGAGDFEITFAAGDARDVVNSGQLSVERDIDASDLPLSLGLAIPLPLGPRKTYVLVKAQDNDFGLPSPGQGLDLVGDVSWGTPANFGSSGSFHDAAQVADIIDVSAVSPGTTTVPFTMSTGRFTVAFTVTGRLVVTALPGESLFFSAPAARAAFLTAVVREPGSSVLVGGSKGKGFIAGLGADGLLWTKAVDPEQSTTRREGWRRTARSVNGPVTVVWTEEDRCEFLAVSAEGSALRLLDGDWSEMGIRSAGAIVAVPRVRGGVDLYATTPEGEVVHGVLQATGDGPYRWRQIGSDVIGGLVALTLPSGATVLLAIGRDRRAVHALSQDGRVSGWRRLVDLPVEWLGAQPFERGFAVAALTEQRHLHVLDWRVYPKPVENDSWRDVGPYDESVPSLIPPRADTGLTPPPEVT